MDRALLEARAIGIPYVEVTTDPENAASQETILNCGGELFEHFIEPAQFGGKPGLRFRIPVGA